MKSQCSVEFSINIEIIVFFNKPHKYLVTDSLILSKHIHLFEIHPFTYRWFDLQQIFIVTENYANLKVNITIQHCRFTCKAVYHV